MEPSVAAASTVVCCLFCLLSVNAQYGCAWRLTRREIRGTVLARERILYMLHACLVLPFVQATLLATGVTRAAAGAWSVCLGLGCLLLLYALSQTKKSRALVHTAHCLQLGGAASVLADEMINKPVVGVSGISLTALLLTTATECFAVPKALALLDPHEWLFYLDEKRGESSSEQARMASKLQHIISLSALEAVAEIAAIHDEERRYAIVKDEDSDASFSSASFSLSSSEEEDSEGG